MCLANTNGVALRLIVQRDELDGFLPILRKNQRAPRRFVPGRKSLTVLKHTLRLNFNPPGFAVSHVSAYLQSPVRSVTLLQPGAGYRAPHVFIHQYDVFLIFIVVFGGVLGQVSTAGSATRRRNKNDEGKSQRG